MKITKIEKFKGKTLGVYFEEEEPVFVNSEIVAEFHLKEGMNIPESAVEQIVKANDTRRARERALYLLDARDYSYTELFKKLEVNYDEDICYEVLNSLAELGVVDDRRYAQRLGEYLIEKKRFGRYRAAMEMKRRGLSKDLISETLDKYDEDSVVRLYELVKEKYEQYLTDQKGVNRVKNALVRKGFSYDDINAVIKTVLSEED